MGLGLYVFIMKGLRDTAEVTKIVVTVSILLGMLSISHWFWHPETARTMQMFFGDQSKITVFGASIRYHELICILVAIGIAVGLRILFTKTRAGVAMRGVVDDPDLLRLNGHNPERLAALSWAMGSTLAVLAGILITPISGGTLEANMLTLLVIDAFAAAMFGRLRSIPRTFVGAVVLGLAGTYVLAYFPTSWSWTSNFRVSLPMIALFVVLIVLPQDRLRGAVTRTRERYHVPSVRKAVIWGVALIVIVYLLRLLMVTSAITTLTIGMTFAIIALSLTLLTGYAGELNLAPVSFGAIATIVAFHFGISGSGLAAHLNLWGIVVGVLVTAVIGGLVALPALRLRGLYLALATMAFGVFLSNMVLRDTTEHEMFGIRYSLFKDGNIAIPPLKVGPLDLSNDTVFLMTVTALFSVLGVGVIALRNSGYGRRLAAMKDSPAGSAMLGQSLVQAQAQRVHDLLRHRRIGRHPDVERDGLGLGGELRDHGLVVAADAHRRRRHRLCQWRLLRRLHGGHRFRGHHGLVHQPGVGAARTRGNVVAAGQHRGGQPRVDRYRRRREPVRGTVHQVVEGYRRLMNAKPVLYGGAAVIAVTYLLALTGVLGNWWFASITIAVVFLLPVIGEMVMPAAVLTRRSWRRRRRWSRKRSGSTSRTRDEVRGELDRELGIDLVKSEKELAAHV